MINGKTINEAIINDPETGSIRMSENAKISHINNQKPILNSIFFVIQLQFLLQRK
jgi:hypothetical protein